MDNEKIASELVEMAQSLTGKNGMKRNAASWGRDHVDIRKLAKDLEKIGEVSGEIAKSEAVDEWEGHYREQSGGDEEGIDLMREFMEYSWTQKVNITIEYSGSSGGEWDEDGISYKLREGGVKMKWWDD